jgi:hypothetical protein
MSATSFTPPSTGLSGTQFSTLNSAGINDPEVPEKYNNSEPFLWDSRILTHSIRFNLLRKQTRIKINKANATFRGCSPPTTAGHTEPKPVEDSRVAKEGEGHDISEMIKTKRGP